MFGDAQHQQLIKTIAITRVLVPPINDTLVAKMLGVRAARFLVRHIRLIGEAMSINIFGADVFRAAHDMMKCCVSSTSR